MYEPWMIVLLTIVGLLVLKLVGIAVLSGGDFSRLPLGWRAAVALIRSKELAEKVQPLLAADQNEQTLSGEPVRILALLQRKARLVDFILEDLSGATNEQLGAAVRNIQVECKNALSEHIDMQPVLDKPEGDQVDVPAGFDPSAIQLTGNVTGNGPFQGILKHRGVRVIDIKLPKPAQGVDELVLQPAIVEI